MRSHRWGGRHPGRRVRALVSWIGRAAAVTACAPVLRPADDPGRPWPMSSVRYLLRDDELQRYERLKTPESRASFVQRFWQRLDPDPATEKNEFREAYELRSEEAERRFAAGAQPGWSTDRGRAYLILGEPDWVRTEPGDPLSVGKEVWVYAHPDGGTADELRLTFYRGADGLYRLNPRSILANRGPGPFDPLRAARSRAALFGLSPRLRRAMLETFVPFDPIAQSARPEPPSRGAPVTPDTGATDAAVRDAAYFFEAADGSVVALLIVGLVHSQAGDEPREGPFAGVAFLLEPGSTGAPAEPVTVALERRAELSSEGHDAYVGRVRLEPGESYGIRYAFTDPEHKTLIVRTARLSAPELGTGGFRASSVVPAERFGPASAEELPLFAIGSEVVVPRNGGIFHRGEPVRLYLQVYGARPDAASPGKPRVDVSFRFEHRTGGRWKRQGDVLNVRSASGASMGLALPVGDWPEGDYRVEVSLHDRVAHVWTRSAGEFTLVD